MAIEDLQRVHFVGIGGIGTSGVARILLSQGKEVSGSDTDDSSLITELKKLGAKVTLGHQSENIPQSTETVVISAAIPLDNPEVLEARRRNIPIITYSQALGSLMERRQGIAVAGTHGKTTTSALVASILKASGKEPNFVIGGEIPALGGNSGTGKGEYLVAEACEFHRNFLSLRPQVIVITNIEEDHLDYYHDLTEIEEAFLKFLSLLPPDGFAVLCRENDNLMEVAGRFDGSYVTYGFGEADFQAKKITLTPDGSSFQVFFQEKELGSVTIPLPGQHNVLNSLAAFSVCYKIGLQPEVIINALADFGGVRRRLELKGHYNGASVLDDYGHHPSEIVATLKALRQFYPTGRLFVVFQPHQYSRTRFFLDDFARSFNLADEVIVPEIYFVRDSEESRRSVSSEDLVAKLTAQNKKAQFISPFEAIVTYLKGKVGKGDVVLTIGAGPVYQVADNLLKPDFSPSFLRP